jgi:CRISPR-associated protein Csb2
MLALKIEYLTGVCVATKHDDPTRFAPEWPPHPDRLYSALVAAAATLPDATGDDLPERAVQALRWLAQESWANGQVIAPELHAPEGRRRLAPEVHMPSNPHEDEVFSKQADKPKIPATLKTLLPVHRKKAALCIPAVVPDQPAVYFVWRDARANGHIETLRLICERVTYLGRSRSLVRISIVDDPPASTHVPDPLGQVEFRVPGPERLEQLRESYNRKGGKPDPCPIQRYRPTHYQHRQKIIPSTFERMYILKPQTGDPTLPATSTEKVTRTLRKALIACIEESQRLRGLTPHVPDIVHGHGRHPHCAYIALPFVNPWQRHADGSIKGLAVLVPRDPKETDLLSLALGLMQLQENGLGIPGIGTWHLTEVPEDDPPIRVLDSRVWRRSSRLWATVTPMVFGHFPKAKNGGAVRVVLESLNKIGIDPDLAIEIGIGEHSLLHGAPRSRDFKSHENHTTSEAPRLIRHVSLRFERPVSGPIVLGSKRYFGLGLMWPLEDR